MNFNSFKNKFKDKYSFANDGRLHYVYKITEIKNNISYIGSRTCKQNDGDNYDVCMNDLIHYGTSSYKKEYIKNNTLLFNFKIIKVFLNPHDKILLESFIHHSLNIKFHSEYWNKSNQTPNGFDTTGLKFKHTQEHILKRTIATKKSMSVIGMDGLNQYQRASIKANKTKMKKDINGINQYQKLAKKAWITKKNNGFEFTSENNPRLNTILIIDNNDNIIEVIDKAFTIFCKENKYPMNAFRKSYVDKGRRLYTDLNNGNLKKMKGTFEYNTFKGWYAMKYTDLSQELLDKLEDIKG